MKDVQRNTEEIAARYDSMGISTVFQLNPGNHFTQTEARIADGIAWISEDA